MSQEPTSLSLNTRRAGVTLVELLVSMAVLGLLLAILLPTLSAGRDSARSIKCKANLRNVCSGFLLFADASGAGTRGQSQLLGEDRFKLEDFQESVYKVDEFYQGPSLISASDNGMLCPAAPASLRRLPNLPCSSGAIAPQENVSVGFNKRLETRSFMFGGRPFPAPAILTPKILQYPNVPLLLDVDGAAAVGAGRQPFYIAPPVLDDKTVDIYESGRFWFPSFRHGGQVNVGFVGGQVISSLNPLQEPWWRWNFQLDS